MIALVDCGGGNVEAISKALIGLKAEYKISANETFICNADKIIFSGSGAPSSTMQKLHLSNLYSAIRMVKKPILGIGLGMQLLCSYTTEGNVGGLGIFPGRTEKFDSSKSDVPFLGLNSIEINRGSLLFDGIKSPEKFYFANSYFIPVDDYTTAAANNGIVFSAAIERDNYFGVQFHPQQSGSAGLILLRNFIELL